MVGGGNGDVQGSGHILLRGHGDAHHRGVVLVDAHDPEGQQLAAHIHPDVIAQGLVGIPLVELLHQLVADHADVPLPVHILPPDAPARQQIRAADVQILLVDAGEGDVGVQPSVLGHAAAGGGGETDAGDGLAVPLPQGVQHLIADKVPFVGGGHPQEGLQAPHAAIPLLLEENGDIGGAQGAHGPGDGPGEAAAHRENADDGTDADDDAQHGQKGAHLVGPKALQRYPDAFTDPHSAPPPPCLPGRAARPAW